MTKGGSRTRMQRVPNVVVVPAPPTKEDSQVSGPVTVKMVKVSSLVGFGLGWTLILAILGWMGEGVNWWVVVNPLIVTGVILLGVGTHEVEE